MLLTHRAGAHLRLNTEKNLRNLFQYNCKFYSCKYGVIVLKSYVIEQHKGNEIGAIDR